MLNGVRLWLADFFFWSQKENYDTRVNDSRIDRLANRRMLVAVAPPRAQTVRRSLRGGPALLACLLLHNVFYNYSRLGICGRMFGTGWRNGQYVALNRVSRPLHVFCDAPGAQYRSALRQQVHYTRRPNIISPKERVERTNSHFA